MKTLMIMLSSIFLGLNPASAGSSIGENTRILKNALEALIIQEMSKERLSVENEATVDAALVMVIRDLNKGLPRSTNVIIHMLENHIAEK